MWMVCTLPLRLLGTIRIGGITNGRHTATAVGHGVTIGVILIIPAGDLEVTTAGDIPIITVGTEGIMTHGIVLGMEDITDGTAITAGIIPIMEVGAITEENIQPTIAIMTWDTGVVCFLRSVIRPRGCRVMLLVAAKMPEHPLDAL